MPVMGGIEAISRIVQGSPRSRVIILTTFARPGYLRRALDAGASGYLLKDAPAEKLADAIRELMAPDKRSGRPIGFGPWKPKP